MSTIFSRDRLNDDVDDLDRFLSGIKECEEVLNTPYESLSTKNMIKIIKASIHIVSILKTVRETLKVYIEFEAQALPYLERKITWDLGHIQDFFQRVIDNGTSFNSFDLMDAKISKNIRILFHNENRRQVAGYPLMEIDIYFGAIEDAISRVHWMEENHEMLTNNVIGWTGVKNEKYFQKRFSKYEKDIAFESTNESYAWVGIYNHESRVMNFRGYRCILKVGGFFIRTKEVTISLSDCLDIEWLDSYLREYVPEAYV